MSFHLRQQKLQYENKNRKPLQSHTNIRDSKRKKSRQKKLNISALTYYQSNTIHKKYHKSALTQSSIPIQYLQENQIRKQVIQSYHENNKQLPNISRIQQKQSFISNKQDSFDFWNNLIPNQQNDHEQSILQSQNNQSKQNNSDDQMLSSQDWSILQNQYQQIFQKQTRNQNLKDYIETLNELKSLNNINQLQILKKQGQSLLTRLQLHLKKTSLLNTKNNSGSFYQQERYSNNSNTEKSLTDQLILNQLKLKKQQSQNLLETSSKQQIQIVDRIQQDTQKYEQKDQEKLMIKTQPNIEIDNNNNSQKMIMEQEIPIIIKQEKDYSQNYEVQNQFTGGMGEQYEQSKMTQEQFIKFVHDKNFEQENQNNISLNNISKIMKVKHTRETHNKSLQNEIKQKQEDEVVAMLQIELRQKKIEQKPQNQQSQILLKQSRDYLSFNNVLEGVNQQQDANNNSINQNNLIYLIFERRQKWIKSRHDKSQKWKIIELERLEKMKKILHNPYIEWEDDEQS